MWKTLDEKYELNFVTGEIRTIVTKRTIKPKIVFQCGKEYTYVFLHGKGHNLQKLISSMETPVSSTLLDENVILSYNNYYLMKYNKSVQEVVLQYDNLEILDEYTLSIRWPYLNGIVTTETLSVLLIKTLLERRIQPGDMLYPNLERKTYHRIVHQIRKEMLLEDLKDGNANRWE